MVRNIKIIISYDGTDYYGWQKQNGMPTIQEEIEKALKKITSEDIEINGSGRTDRGVHALGQCASFTTESRVPADKFKLALNSNLPSYIRILESDEQPLDFHARFNAKGKTYLYQIYNRRINSPFYSRYAYHIPYELDIKRIEKASKLLIGEHDFHAFMASGSQIKNTVRSIYEINFNKNNDLLAFEITGSGFLYNMVRIIAGTFIDIGSGKRNPKCITAAISSGNREVLGHTARPEGLFLKEVYYKDRS